MRLQILALGLCKRMIAETITHFTLAQTISIVVHVIRYFRSPFLHFITSFIFCHFLTIQEMEHCQCALFVQIVACQKFISS